MKPKDAFFGEPTVTTPEREQAWSRWKDDYIATCAQQWMEQGASRDEIHRSAAIVFVDLSQIDDEPWMPLGVALQHRMAAVLAPDATRSEEDRVNFIRAMRTAETSTQQERALAIAYQLGISVSRATSIVRGVVEQQRGRDADRTGHTALYRHFDAFGRLLYVGIAQDPGRRTEQHGHYSPWFRFVASTDVAWFDTRREAEAAERLAISDERPVFNQTHNKANRDAAVEYLFGALDEPDDALANTG